MKDGCNTTDIIRPQILKGWIPYDERDELRRDEFDLKCQSTDGSLPVGSHTWQDASFARDSDDLEDSEEGDSEEDDSEEESHGESPKDRVVTITLVTREQHEQTLESIEQLLPYSFR